MKFNNKITIDMSTAIFKLKQYVPLVFTGALSLLLASCGTYSKGYDQNDGIYASGNQTAENEANANDSYEKSNYYKQYFQSKAIAYSDVPEEGAIFTDIEAYSTSESLDENGNIIIEDTYVEDGYGPWGNNAESVTVNIYNSGSYGFYYNPFYYNYWGWGYPYYRYHSPYWGISYGWGWGYPYYGYYGYPFYGYPYYGYGYYNGYPYYNYSHYNDYSYNRGRRNTDYVQSRDRARTVSPTRSNSYSRSEAARRINRNSVRANTTRSENTRVIRSNPNQVIRNSSSNTTRSGSYSPPVRSNNTTRSGSYSSPTRSSNSGSIRSSGNSGRSSSGSTRSSGSRGRG
jgi:hypothetical protein